MITTLLNHQKWTGFPLGNLGISPVYEIMSSLPLSILLCCHKSRYLDIGLTEILSNFKCYEKTFEKVCLPN